MPEVDEFVLYERNGIYHRRRSPMENDQRGMILTRKSSCGHWYSYGCTRKVAEATGRLPCKICFR